MARYDYGLRGYPDEPRRRPGQPWNLRTTGDDPRDFPAARAARYAGDFGASGWRPTGSRVTARYNLDYVLGPGPEQYRANYAPYGGDTDWRIGDFRRYERPYLTHGGTRTYRGEGRIGWERERARELAAEGYRWAPYDREYLRYDGDFPRYR